MPSRPLFAAFATPTVAAAASTWTMPGAAVPGTAAPKPALVPGTQFTARANQAKLEFELALRRAQDKHNEVRRAEERTVVEHQCAAAYQRAEPNFTVAYCEEGEGHEHDICKSTRRFHLVLRVWETIKRGAHHVSRPDARSRRH